MSSRRVVRGIDLGETISLDYRLDPSIGWFRTDVSEEYAGAGTWRSQAGESAIRLVTAFGLVRQWGSRHVVGRSRTTVFQAPARSLAGYFLAIVLSGCTSLPNVTAPPVATANPWLQDAELSRAIAFRTKAGLEADLPWVRAVAARVDIEPGIESFGVPLTPAELQDLLQRAGQSDAVLAVVERYGGEHQSVWGGATIDTTTGAVVARFTDGPDVHEAALRARLSPNARLFVVEVRWSLEELQPVFDRIHDDWVAGRWLLDQGVYPVRLSVDVTANQVTFGVSSARSGLETLLEDHYDAAGMLNVVSDGTGIKLLPTGTLDGKVVDRNGRPVVGAIVELQSTVPGAGIGGDLGYATSDVGRFHIPEIPAVDYEVFIYSDAPIGDRVLLGTGSVKVAANQTTSVKITTG